MPLICDDYEPLDDLALAQIPDVWTAQQKQILAYHGITMEDVQTVSWWISDLIVFRMIGLESGILHDIIIAIHTDSLRIDLIFAKTSGTTLIPNQNNQSSYTPEN